MKASGLVFVAILRGRTRAVLWVGQTKPSSWTWGSSGEGVLLSTPTGLNLFLECAIPSLCHGRGISAGSRWERRMWSTCRGWRRSETLRWTSNAKTGLKGAPLAPAPLQLSFNPPHLQSCPDHFSQIQLDTNICSRVRGRGRGARSEIHTKPPPNSRHGGATNTVFQGQRIPRNIQNFSEKSTCNGTSSGVTQVCPGIEEENAMRISNARSFPTSGDHPAHIWGLQVGQRRCIWGLNSKGTWWFNPSSSWVGSDLGRTHPHKNAATDVRGTEASLWPRAGCYLHT